MIYTGPNFWITSLGNNTDFGAYPLWEAHYTSAAAPAAIGGWATYTLWQFTSSATVPGITGNVDQNRFNNSNGANLANLHAPNGAFDSVRPTVDSKLAIQGWAIDPDSPTAPVTIRVQVDGAPAQTVTANQSRPDVASVYPAAGDLHGFAATAPVSPGTHNVCVSAVDTTDSTQSTPLGCRSAALTGSWFYLNDQNSGTANIVLAYGDPGDQVLVANTDGSGGDKLLIRRGSTYYVRNSLTTGPGDYSFVYGNPTDTVLVGDWNGDGKDTLAVRRGNTYYIKNSLSTGTADAVINYGNPTDTVLVGDWNGDGTDTLAVRRGGTYYLKNALTTGVADVVFAYGDPGDTVLAGNWNGHSTGLAVRRGNTYYLKNALTTGVADVVFAYGDPGDTVLVGDWNGDGTDSLGVRRVG
jgi:hypothetical protein